MLCCWISYQVIDCICQRFPRLHAPFQLDILFVKTETEISLTPTMVLLKCNFMCACVLACSHTCANMCPITSDGTLVSLTYCTRVLHEGLHTRVCCSSGYIHICYSLVAYMQQTEPQKDSFTGRLLIRYYKWLLSMRVCGNKDFASHEMCKFSLFCFQKERWCLWMSWIQTGE